MGAYITQGFPETCGKASLKLVLYDNGDLTAIPYLLAGIWVQAIVSHQRIQPTEYRPVLARLSELNVVV